MSKFQDIVSWVMEDDKILKVQKKGVVYDIADNVYEFLKGKNLLSSLPDKEVEIEVDETKGQSGTIIHLTVVDGKEDKKPEPVKDGVAKLDAPKVDSGLVVKEIDVTGVSVQNKGVVTKEKVWYTLDSTIDVNKFKDECTKKTVEVTILPQEKGNDIIKGYVLKVVEEPKTDKCDESPKKSYSNDVQRSIEAQASVNSANEIVSHMTDILLDPEKVLTTITKIAEHNFLTIQNLKNKE